MKAHPDGCPDVPDLEAAIPDQPQSDADRKDRCAWDASGVAPLDVTGDVARRIPVLPEDAGAGKLAGRAQDVPVRDASSRWARLAAEEEEPAVAAALCTPDAAQSAARSCAAQAVAAVRELRWALPDVALQQASAEQRRTL